MKEQVRNHIEEKFQQAELHLLPFPHLIIDAIFPDSVYEKILEYNLFRQNDGEEWASRAAMRKIKTRTPYDHRRQINFHANDEFDATAEQREFWDCLSACFLEDNWFIDLVYHKFPDYFVIRFGEYFEPGNYGSFNRQLFLQRHEPGYFIGPHTDIPTRIFTCIFSFADAPGFDSYGTQLLRHKDPRKRCWGNDHYGFEDFELVKTSPYLPNHFLLFFKTTQSFHAVKTVDEDVPNQRYGMQFQFYEQPKGTFLDMSKSGLYERDHQNTYGKLVTALKNKVR